MHQLLHKLLVQKQLSSASQIFHLNNYDVINDIHAVFKRLKAIFNDEDYITNRVDQSAVEIVIARVTAAIRETRCIETYAAELVDLLDSSLKHPMTILQEDGTTIDSPHCKIASDLLASLFLHYAQKSVMTLAIPISVKVLECSNNELVRSSTSYISLAAIHNSKSLAHYSLQIIQFITGGNYSLLRVLPQIYPENREPFHAHLPQLIEVLHKDEVECSEKLSLLQLSSMIANNNPEVLHPFLDTFSSFFLDPQLSTALLNICMSFVSQNKSNYLSRFLPSLKAALRLPDFKSNRLTICKVIGSIGRESERLADEVIEQLLKLAVSTTDQQMRLSILIEIEGIGAAFPTHIAQYSEDIRFFLPNRTAERILALGNGEFRKSISSQVNMTFLDARTENPNSLDSLESKMLIGGEKTNVHVDDSRYESYANELDKNTHSLAMQYENHRSSASLKSRSHSYIGQSNYLQSSELGDSRELSLISAPSSSRALTTTYTPQANIQMGKDGRVRPVTNARKPVQWPAGCTQTTFPAHPGPITTSTMCALNEEDEFEWGEKGKKDLVYQFVDHRRNKIRRYINEVSSVFPIPIQCTVEESKNNKHRMIVHFACQNKNNQYCVFTNDFLFAYKTKLPALWMHLMFLQMECCSMAQTGEVQGKESTQYQTLAHCWQCLPSSITKGVPFDTLVTRAFPTLKDQQKIVKELEESGVYNCFTFDSLRRWSCVSCSNPEKVKHFVEDTRADRVIEGQLKQKKGRWRFLRRWHTKYFTLSSASLNCSTRSVHNDSRALLGGIDLRSIRSVRSLGRGKKSRKSLRNAFEIATADNTSVVLKAKDEKKAVEWMQCLQIAVAHARKENSVFS